MSGREPVMQEKQEKYPALRGPHKADAVIVGGGLTGMTTALWLCRAGLRVILLEAETLGCGATARCAGMLSLTGRLMLERLEQQRGIETAGAYLRSQMASFSGIRSLAEAGDFDWQDADAGLLSSEQETALFGEAEALRRAGASAGVSAPVHSPLPCKSVLTLRNMAVLDPQRYFTHLTDAAVALGLRIHEHSRVTGLETNQAQTGQGIVNAPYIIIATGYPVINTPGWYFTRLVQRRRTRLVLTSSVLCEGIFWESRGSYGLRKWQEGLMLQMDGGLAGKRMEESWEKIWQRQFAPWLEGSSVAQSDEGLEVFSADGLPYIGAYSRKTPNLFVASGYGGQGLLGSMTAARLISARILGLTEESAYVFSGQRNGNAVRRAEAVSAAAAAGRYLGSMLHLFAPHCPHMGCRLSYSHTRHIWECPCHGSRFDDIGHLLNAPAAEDAMIRHRR